MPVDDIQRKLNFPPSFVPYLEKHRIFELFHEMAEELVMAQPRDHVTFLRNIIRFADKKRNSPRIIFLAPPNFDHAAFAEKVAEETGTIPIYRNRLEDYQMNRTNTEKLSQAEERQKNKPTKTTGSLDLENISPQQWRQEFDKSGLTLSQVGQAVGDACGCARYYQHLFKPTNEDSELEEESQNNNYGEEVGEGEKMNWAEIENLGETDNLTLEEGTGSRETQREEFGETDKETQEEESGEFEEGEITDKKNSSEVKEVTMQEESNQLNLADVKTCPCKFNLWKLMEGSEGGEIGEETNSQIEEFSTDSDYGKEINREDSGMQKEDEDETEERKETWSEAGEFPTDDDDESDKRNWGMHGDDEDNEDKSTQTEEEDSLKTSKSRNNNQMTKNIQMHKKRNTFTKKEKRGKEGSDKQTGLHALRSRHKVIQRGEGVHQTTKAESMAQLLQRILKQDRFRRSGWILVDMPANIEEANAMAKAGLVPTHALHIVTGQPLVQTQQQKSRLWERQRQEEILWSWEDRRRYRMDLLGWRNHYAYVPVTEVLERGRDPNTLARDLCKLIRTMPHRHPPMMPRILLLGARGSGLKTQARKLVEKYQFVHVAYEDVIARAMEEDHTYAELYRQQIVSGYCEPEVEAALIEKALLSKACQEHGWVLTGYPTNIKQLRMLDLIETPPNRVIFLEVPPKECFLRVHYRQTDPVLGDTYTTPQVKPTYWGDHDVSGIDAEIRERVRPHPRDDKKTVIQEIEDYHLCKKDLVSYCGRSAEYINGNQPIEIVFQLLEQVILRSAPACRHRQPMSRKNTHQGTHELYQGYRSMANIKDRFRLLTRKKIIYVDPANVGSETSLQETICENE